MFQIDKTTGEFVRDDSGTPIPMTAHTLNPVPLWIVGAGLDGVVADAGLSTRRLSNVASTALLLLGYEAPDDMDPSLIRLSDSD